MRVLVADDSAAVALLTSRALAAIGCEVTTVADGIAAFHQGLSGAFDVALLDMIMPGMLGTEVLAGWAEAGLSLPTIVFSGVDDENLTLRCLELGALDFIHKPFDVRELQLRVRVHLAHTKVS